MWLMALTIPLQGMAAVTMPMCPAAHHSNASLGFDQWAAQAEAGDTMATAADHAMHHDATDVVNAVDEADAASLAQDDDGAAGPSADACDVAHSMLKCCSAACSLAAMMAPDLALQAFLRSPAPLHPVAQFYRGVPPDGLDRPPKSVLA